MKKKKQGKQENAPLCRPSDAAMKSIRTDRDMFEVLDAMRVDVLKGRVSHQDTAAGQQSIRLQLRLTELKLKAGLSKKTQNVIGAMALT